MKRIITGLLLVGLILAALFLLELSPLYFAALIAIIAAFGIYEMANAQKDILPLSYKILLGVLAVSLLPVFVIKHTLGSVFILIALLFLIALTIMTFNPEIPVASLQAFILILFYPTILLALILELIYNENALFLLVTVFGIGPMADSMAFAVGCTLKGPKLYPKVSPKKTISGAIGGLFGGIIAGIAIFFIFTNLLPQVVVPPLYIMVIVGFIGALFTGVGDLAESAIKRRFQIKDFGKILPGHGGVLDRMDGIMFNTLFVYAFFSYIFPLI